MSTEELRSPRFEQGWIQDLYLSGEMTRLEAEVADITYTCFHNSSASSVDMCLEHLRTKSVIDILDQIWKPTTTLEAVLLFQRSAKALAHAAEVLLHSLGSPTSSLSDNEENDEGDAYVPC